MSFLLFWVGSDGVFITIQFNVRKHFIVGENIRENIFSPLEGVSREVAQSKTKISQICHFFPL